MNRMDEKNLREEVMINQLINICGGTRDQALQILCEAKWNFDVALSLILREAHLCSAPSQNTYQAPFRAPRNTPATPPNFPETLELFHKLHTNDNLPSQTSQPVPENAQLKS